MNDPSLLSMYWVNQWRNFPTEHNLRHVQWGRAPQIPLIETRTLFNATVKNQSLATPTLFCWVVPSFDLWDHSSNCQDVSWHPLIIRWSAVLINTSQSALIWVLWLCSIFSVSSLSGPWSACRSSYIVSHHPHHCEQSFSTYPHPNWWNPSSTESGLVAQ